MLCWIWALASSPTVFGLVLGLLGVSFVKAGTSSVCAPTTVLYSTTPVPQRSHGGQWTKSCASIWPGTYSSGWVTYRCDRGEWIGSTTCQTSSCTNTIKGILDWIAPQPDGDLRIRGWSCAVGCKGSDGTNEIHVRARPRGASGTGTFLLTARTSFASTYSNSQCGVSAKHGFQLDVPASQWAAHAGEELIVVGKGHLSPIAYKIINGPKPIPADDCDATIVAYSTTSVPARSHGESWTKSCASIWPTQYGGGYVTYSCDDGTWEASNSCDERSCEGTPIVYSTTSVPARSHGESWTKSCASVWPTQYEVGDVTYFCNDGTWEASNSCVKRSCEATTVVYSYTTVPARSHGESWTKSCALVWPTVYGVGDVTYFCNDGTWEASNSCDEQSCEATTVVYSTTSVPAKIHGESWTKSCASIWPTQYEGGDVTYFCDDGTWDASNSCVERSCDTTTVPFSTTSVPARSHGESWTKSCALVWPTECEGGDVTYSCDKGTWDASNSCVERSCDATTVAWSSTPVPQGQSGQSWTKSCALIWPTRFSGGSVTYVCYRGSWDFSDTCEEGQDSDSDDATLLRLLYIMSLKPGDLYYFPEVQLIGHAVLGAELTPNENEAVQIRLASSLDKTIRDYLPDFAATLPEDQVIQENLMVFYVAMPMSKPAFLWALRTQPPGEVYSAPPKPGESELNHVSNAQWDAFAQDLFRLNDAHNRMINKLEAEDLYRMCPPHAPVPLLNMNTFGLCPFYRDQYCVEEVAAFHRIPLVTKRNGNFHKIGYDGAYSVQVGSSSAFQDMIGPLIVTIAVVAVANWAAAELAPLAADALGGAVAGVAGGSAWAGALGSVGSALTYAGVQSVSQAILLAARGEDISDAFDFDIEEIITDGIVAVIIQRVAPELDQVLEGALEDTWFNEDTREAIADVATQTVTNALANGGDLDDSFQAALQSVGFVELSDFADAYFDLADVTGDDLAFKDRVQHMIKEASILVLIGQDPEDAIEEAIRNNLPSLQTLLNQLRPPGTVDPQVAEDAFQRLQDAVNSGQGGLTEKNDAVLEAALKIGLDEQEAQVASNALGSIPEPNYDYINDYGVDWLSGLTDAAAADDAFQLSLEDRFTTLIQGSIVDPNIEFNPISAALPDGCSNISCMDPNRISDEVRTNPLVDTDEVDNHPEQLNPLQLFFRDGDGDGEPDIGLATLRLDTVEAMGVLCAEAFKRDPRVSAACELATMFSNGEAVLGHCVYDPSVFGCGAASGLLLSNALLAVLPSVRPLPPSDVDELIASSLQYGVDLGTILLTYPR